MSNLQKAAQNKLLYTHEQQLETDHPTTAGSLFNLAVIYYNTLGAHHPTTQTTDSWLQPIQQAVEANPD